MTYPSGRIVSYTCDASGRITAVATRQTAAASPLTLASSITYQPLSTLLASLTTGNGLTETATYSLDYELSTAAVQDGGANVCAASLSRADALNLTGISDAVTPANAQSFAYSPANRLSSATGAYGAYTWTAACPRVGAKPSPGNGVGNRTGETSTPPGGAAQTRSYSYPPTSNRLSEVLLGVASERLIGHDGAGNIVSDTRSGTAYGYTYNARNRLDTVSVAGVTQAAYTYNGLEQLAIRVNIAGGAATTHYLHDLAGNVIAETDGTGAAGTVREVVWLPETEISPTMGSRTTVDRPLAVVDGVDTTPVTWWVHVDHLNRPIKMTDAARASVWTAVWAPWGAPSSITGTATLDARFPGQWFQLEAGLLHNWHRHYDPTLGRYTQPDPLGFVDGPGVFGYARGSPLGYVDPDGQYRRRKPPTSPAGVVLEACLLLLEWWLQPEPPTPIPNKRCKLFRDMGDHCLYNCPSFPAPVLKPKANPFDTCPEWINEDDSVPTVPDDIPAPPDPQPLPEPDNEP